jgi:hypothetical protein
MSALLPKADIALHRSECLLSLGDLDQTEWPVSQVNNEPRDPWIPQTLLVLQNTESNALYTYIASAISARNSVDNLLRQYAYFPDETPLVKLSVAKYQHKTRKTWIHYLDFRLCGRTKIVKPAEASAVHFLGFRG